VVLDADEIQPTALGGENLADDLLISLCKRRDRDPEP
jgi:hypothetical protein